MCGFARGRRGEWDERRGGELGTARSVSCDIEGSIIFALDLPGELLEAGETMRGEGNARVDEAEDHERRGSRCGSIRLL